MDPMNHPHARRTRLILICQVVGASFMLVALPIATFVIQQPPREHELITLLLMPVFIVVILIGLREIKKVRHTFRYEDTPEDAQSQ